MIADYDVVAGQLTNGRLADGTPLTPAELVEAACAASILPALFDANEQPLWLGRARRHASDGQRAVLAARDKCCVGCGATLHWCQPHHIAHWEHGGGTDLDNLCMLCNHCHHKRVHTLGAEVTRDPHGKYGLRSAGAPPPPVAAGNGVAGTGNTIDRPLRC